MATLNHAKIITALETLAFKKDKSEFIYDFLSAYGTPNSTITRLKSGDKQRNVAQIAGDIAVPRSIYFKVVKQGVSVSETLDEILALPLIKQHKIRFVIVTNFVDIATYDCKIKDNSLFEFLELPHYYDFFLPLTGKYEKAIVYAEHPADVKACEKMGRLYDSICDVNHYAKDELHILNVFLTRLLFCFFAEDTGIFPKPSQMTLALESLTQKDGSDLTDFFERLFLVLSCSHNSPKRKNLAQTFQDFPYVNGGLFQEQIIIPKFNARSRRLLLECGKMEWQEISPVIFGAMFQAVMDPERRRSMGAHYTSEKNILKVIRPLFLDVLHEELETILTKNKGKKIALDAFHKKLSSLGFLDPACGCGNFLIVAYRELKELELQTILALHQIEHKTLVLNVSIISKVNINQFYGIELEEFPVEVARVSMWLMEHVMNVKFGKSLGIVIPSIPLQHSATIVCTNALTTPWEGIAPPEKLNYIFGNPPFSGARMMTQAQKQEVVLVAEQEAPFPIRYKNLADDLDYVTAWYFKASKFIKNTEIFIAFVSTNSICQGEQVAPLWDTLLNDYGMDINFAYKTFIWSNEATNKAAVYCVVIGFSNKIGNTNKKFIFDSKSRNIAENISPYLLNSPPVIVKATKKQLSNIQQMKFGSQPRDGGHFVLSEEEYINLIKNDSSLSSVIREYIGSAEFINSKKRYCIWLHQTPTDFIEKSVFLQERIEQVKNFRLQSKAKTTNQYANVPSIFAQIAHPYSDYLIIPRVSSEKRHYIPMGFLSKNTIASDAVQIVPNATRYHFGILTSAMHMTWMRTVCGRLEMRYRYSRDLCYNTFPWPESTEKQCKHIEELAQTVLDTREMYPDMTLAQLYNPDTMPEDLQEAHTTLDLAVDKLYQNKPFADDDARLQLLFKLYAELVESKSFLNNR